MKILFAMLLVIASAFAFAIASVDAQHPYLALTTNSDKTATIYIGAIGEYAPYLTNNGEVVFRTMYIQVIAQNGMATGEQFESLGVINCDEQVYKLVTFWHKPSNKEEGLYMFPKETIIDSIVNEFKNQQSVKVKPNSVMSNLVDASCNYVNKPKPKKDTAIKIEI